MIAEIFEIFLILDFFKKNVNNVLGRVYFYQYYSFTVFLVMGSFLVFLMLDFSQISLE